MKYFTLNDGNKIPALGLGTYKITEEKDIYRVIEAGLKNGYEYFDTAKLYENEKFIGRALKNSPAKRSDYMIASKVWPSMYGIDLTKKSIDESLRDLQTDYIDIIHLHWYGKYFKQAFKVFLDYKRQGIVKSIAVCNFNIEQMNELIEEFEKPVMNQLESNPHLQDYKTYEFLQKQNILHQAWSPLARGRSGLLEEEVLKELSEKYKKTPAQIALKWNVQRNVMVLPKSVSEERIKENISIFDFDLDDDDMDLIKTIDKNKRYSHAPDEKEWLLEIGRE